MLPGFDFSRYIPLTSTNSRSFRRESSRSTPAGQCDVTKQCRRVHLLGWKFPQAAFHHQIRFDSGWYSLRPWTSWTRIFTSSESSIWESPEMQFTGRFGKCIKLLCIGSIRSFLKQRNWRFTEPGRTRSFTTILSHLPALKRWLLMSGEILYDKVYESPRSTANDHPERSPARRTTGKSDATIPSQYAENRCFERGRQFSKSWPQNPRVAALDIGKSRQLKKDDTERINSSDREPSSQRCAEGRFDAKSNVQPIQWKIEEHDPGHENVEYFETCEITSKVQCSHCLSCWTKGIVYCTYGMRIYEDDVIPTSNMTAMTRTKKSKTLFAISGLSQSCFLWLLIFQTSFHDSSWRASHE